MLIFLKEQMEHPYHLFLYQMQIYMHLFVRQNMKKP